MLLNTRTWEVGLKISNLELTFPNACGTSITKGDSAAISIPATSVKGALRSYLGRLDTLADFTQDLFGSEVKAARLRITDLCLDPNISQPDPEVHLHTSISRVTGAVEHGKLFESQVLSGATFRGRLDLINGGINPAVLTYHYLSKALPSIRLGRGLRRGYGSVETCNLHRSDSDGDTLLNPIENIFRKSGHEIIRHIAVCPDLIYSLEWRDLERVIALTFEEIGYQVQLTKAAQDGGKDVVLYCVSGRDAGGKSLEYYVEIKHWKAGAKVGRGTISKLIEVSIHDGVTGAAFISSSGYADNIKEGSFDSITPKLGDLSTIRTLCRYFVASRSNKLFTTKSLEELLNTNWQD